MGREWLKQYSREAILGPVKRGNTMSNMNIENKQNRGYRALILLLVALAVFSSAMRDIERLEELANSLEELTAAVSGHNPFSASAATISPSARIIYRSAAGQERTDEFRWAGRVAQGKTIEIKGINGNIFADGTSDSEVRLVAKKSARESDINLVNIKVVEHADGVTICAIYPTSDPNQMTRCEPGKSPTAINLEDVPSSSSSMVTNNDVRVDFRISVPAGVNFAGRTVNGEITAQALKSNASVKTVNGSIEIATTGYADAKTVNGEISATIGDPNWNGALNFKTINGAINLNLPAGLNTTVQAKTSNGAINSDFPLTVLGKYGRREVSGTIGTGGGRELVLKTLNGTINLRRVG